MVADGLSLVSTGFIFQDSFTLGSLSSSWQMSPSDNSLYDVGSGLVLQHSANGPVYAFLSQLSSNQNFVFEINTSYTPSGSGDMGGIVVFSTSSDKIDFTQYYDQSTGAVAYPYMRVERSGNEYTFMYSEDGQTWTTIGTETFDNATPLIGISLYGAAGNPMTVNYAKVYGSPYVTINNVASGQSIELLDTNSNVVVSGTINSTPSYELNTFSVQFPFSGSIVLNGTAQELPQALWGGDQYYFAATPDLYYLDNAGNLNLLTNAANAFLGNFNPASGESYMDTTLVVKNNSQVNTYSTVQLSVLSSTTASGYAPQLGIVGSDGTAGNLSAMVTINNLSPNTSQDVTLRLYRDPTIVGTPYDYFNLDMYASV